jgi:hypothetical protein
LRYQAAQFSRPLRRHLLRRRHHLPLRRAIDTTSLGASAASLDTALSLSPSPTPSLGDPAFGHDAAGGVSIVVPNPNPIAPSPTSSPTLSLHTTCTRCVILLPSRPPSQGSKSSSHLGRACKAGRPTTSHQLAAWRHGARGGTALVDLTKNVSLISQH